ncbi:serine/arginine repetitive matrix protein 1 [Anopheles cruzii]|uniref:serine/arginine repetitive matrix protein 1 n=1 Tax=Anopheles cruzii TaxID=68878 RepID=UPI0022EC715E|nr:serine/arginine repetitive matrix protein 1 [Anopheles cruzii]
MIGSFWNLCRACPSMPVDKLHSEYRSTYRWHEYTGGPDVVRKPPVPNQFASSKADHFFSKSTEDEKFIEASINEPPLPRRKKCPELAYRTNEFLATRAQNNAAGHDRTDTAAVATQNRARSEERGTPSRRSKSEGPPAGVANGRLPTGTGYVNGTAEPPVSSERRALEQAGESSTSGLFKKTITKLSTEYRLQFVWPHVRRAIKGGPVGGGGGAPAAVHGGGDADGADAVDAPPRKSLSMGALRAAQTGTAGGGGTIASVHKKRTTNEREATATELEPLFNDCEPAMEKQQQQHTEKRDMARVVEQKVRALRIEKEKFGFEPEGGERARAQANSGIDNAWYKEVLELRKKAGEYRNRGWGVEMNPDLFNKQVELWDQVSRRSSLSALSLASSVRPITKEEKEKENNKKSSPTKPATRRAVPGGARPVEIQKALPEGLNFSAAGATSSRSRKEAIRHHLERTTGPDVEDGALLPSPTREKLMPTIPRSKADSPQRGSPSKTALSRHGSPQKGSPQKSSPKKVSGKGRSQSVGPAVAGAEGGAAGAGGAPGSPKRQIRSGSTVASATAASTAKTHKKTPTSATAPAIAHNPPHAGPQPERRPRPTSLSTTNHSRSKSSTLPASRLHPPHTTGILTNLTNNNHLPNASPSSSAAAATGAPVASAAARAKLSLATGGGLAGGRRQPAGQMSRPTKPTSLASDSSAPSSASSTLRKRARVAAASGGGVGAGGRGSGGTAAARSVEADKTKLPTGNVEDADKDSVPVPVIAGTTPSALPPPPEILEQIIKSPPEPTRVKSPEQIIMRSPDPVNWTVPLDTGKTFTVTQNVREGDPMIRPHSEIKASTPVDQPPPPPQSAPPELSEQSKMPNTKLEPSSIKESEDEDDDLPRSKSSVASSINPTSVAISEPMTVSQPPPPPPSAGADAGPQKVLADAPPSGAPEPAATEPTTARFDKPVPGSTLRCLDDPAFESDINSPLGNRSVATEVLDKARDRFDRFWGNPNEKPDEP